MIAEVFPHSRELATKTDLHEMRTELKDAFTALSVEFADLRTEVHKLHTSALRWMLGLFIPVWAVTAGTLLTVVLNT